MDTYSNAVWERAARAAIRARSSGALQPIDAEAQVVPDGGTKFVVRAVASLLRKFADQAKAQPQRNPFLPYEEALYVCDASADHVVLLNKFPVMPMHLLVITRTFVPQDTLLQLGDFTALAKPMAERPCIAFYNAGRAAGASQPHRHLQIVPLPLEPDGDGTPIDSVLQAVRGKEGRNTADLGFNHVLGWLDARAFAREAQAGAMLEACYRRLLATADISEFEGDGVRRQSQAYNLLATREWMLLVPRVEERFEGISVNALGFAGSLFVKDAAQLELVARVGPRAVLAAVT